MTSPLMVETTQKLSETRRNLMDTQRLLESNHRLLTVARAQIADSRRLLNPWWTLSVMMVKLDSIAGFGRGWSDAHCHPRRPTSRRRERWRPCYVPCVGAAFGPARSRMNHARVMEPKSGRTRCACASGSMSQWNRAVAFHPHRCRHDFLELADTEGDENLLGASLQRWVRRSGVQGGSKVMATATAFTPGIVPTACRTHSDIASCSGQPSAVSVMMMSIRSPSIRTS